MKECHYPLFQSNGGGDQSWEEIEESHKLRNFQFGWEKRGRRGRDREGKKRKRKREKGSKFITGCKDACLLTSLNVKFCSFHSTGKIISKKRERERNFEKERERERIIWRPEALPSAAHFILNVQLGIVWFTFFFLVCTNRIIIIMIHSLSSSLFLLLFPLLSFITQSASLFRLFILLMNHFTHRLFHRLFNVHSIMNIQPFCFPSSSFFFSLSLLSLPLSLFLITQQLPSFTSSSLPSILSVLEPKLGCYFRRDKRKWTKCRFGDFWNNFFHPLSNELLSE